MVFQNYFAEMPTPQENLESKKAELVQRVNQYQSDQQKLQSDLQDIIKLQGGVDALQELVNNEEETSE